MINNFERGNIMIKTDLTPFESPENERSVWKNVPMQYLDFVKDCLAKATSITGCKYRIRFRGPRHDAMKLYCLKNDAKTFAVYPLPRV